MKFALFYPKPTKYNGSNSMNVEKMYDIILATYFQTIAH